MTPYEELFNTANSKSIAQSNERLEAVAFAQNLYRTLVRRWGIPEDRASLFPPFGEFDPDITYTPAGAIVERSVGGWCFGIQVVFAPAESGGLPMPVGGPSVTTRILIRFARENGAYSVEAVDTEGTIRPDAPEDYEVFVDRLFAVVKRIFSEEKQTGQESERMGFVINPSRLQRTNERKSLVGAFPVIEEAQWPDDLSLRREDMYDDTGR